MQYKILKRTHESYDYDFLERMESLYEGGDTIINNASMFIPQKPMEAPIVYQSRLAHASYINYMAEIIDYFTASLFAKPFSVLSNDSIDPFYKDFASDADLAGNSFATVMRRALTDTLTYGFTLIGVDFPRIEELPSTLAEEEELNAGRAYLYTIEPDHLINWKMDNFGKFKWAIIKNHHKVQEGPFDDNSLTSYCFTVWTMQNNVATWEMYEIQSKKEPKDNDDIPLIAKGETSFHEIPIVKMTVETGLHIGNKIGSLCADHFRQRTSLLFSQDRSLYSTPIYKQGEDTVMSAPSEDPNRGKRGSSDLVNKGFVVIGANDDMSFLEPSGSCYELVSKQLNELADEIHRVVHQMANASKSTSTALGRSGASKTEDRASTEIILQEYASAVKETAKQIYNIISEARQENILWTTAGLSNYETVDRDSFTKEALAVQGAMNLPSPTFHKKYGMRLVSQFLPALDPETAIQIEKELDQNLTDMMQHPEPVKKPKDKKDG